MVEDLWGGDCWHLHFLISETPQGIGCTLGTFFSFFPPFKALADCLTTSYLRTVLGVERVPSQYDLPHTEERLLGPYCVGIGAEACPAKKRKLDRACILPNFSRHALVHCSLFSPADSSV